MRQGLDLPHQLHFRRYCFLERVENGQNLSEGQEGATWQRGFYLSLQTMNLSRVDA